MRITVQCQHPDIPLPTPQASTSSSASIVPSNALVVRSSASPHRRDADDTIHDLGDATFCDQPHAPDALANLTFMALALSHAEREKNSKASTIPKSVKMQGMRYKPQPQPGWSGAKKERKHVAQTFHVSKRPYVRSRVCFVLLLLAGGVPC